MQVQQNKERLLSVCSPTHRKVRDGWGTQFHPLWVGEAGGRLKRNKLQVQQNKNDCRVCAIPPWPQKQKRREGGAPRLFLFLRGRFLGLLLRNLGRLPE